MAWCCCYRIVACTSSLSTWSIDSTINKSSVAKSLSRSPWGLSWESKLHVLVIIKTALFRRMLVSNNAYISVCLGWSLTPWSCTVAAYFTVEHVCVLVVFFLFFFLLLVHCSTRVHFVPAVAKMEAQSSTEFTAHQNNKAGSVISIDMGGANKGCIYMWDSAAEYIQASSADV